MWSLKDVPLMGTLLKMSGIMGVPVIIIANPSSGEFDSPEVAMSKWRFQLPVDKNRDNNNKDYNKDKDTRK